MRKLIIHIILVLLTLLSISCVRQAIEEASDYSSLMRLTARMELDSETKTILSDRLEGLYYPLWAESDSLAVFTGQGQKPAAFSIINGVHETTAIFEGPRNGEQYVALFPFRPEAQWENGQLSFMLPETQYYFPNSFSVDGFPMVAVSNDEELHFKNLCSIIRLSLIGSGVVGGITLHSDSHFLSGPVSVSLPFSDYPELVMQEGGTHEVRLDCGAVVLDKENPQDFYIVIPAGTYDGFSIEIDAYTASVSKSYTQEITFGRSMLRPIAPFVVEAPMIDLDHVPSNQIWYKTKSGKAYPLEGKSFDAHILSNTYSNDYGVVSFDAPVKEIKENAFALNDYWNYWSSSNRASDIVEIHLPDCVEAIGPYAIPELASLRIPANLKSLGERNLSFVHEIYGSLVSEDGRAVVSDGILLGVAEYGINDYTTPPGVHTLGEHCFDVRNLKNIIVSEGVRYVRSGAFSSSSIQTLYMPDSIEIIEDQQNLSGIKEFNGSLRCVSQDHRCLINPRSNYGPAIVSIVPHCVDEVYTIPEGIRMLGYYFYDWPNLRKIILPKSMSSFGMFPIVLECPNFEGFEGPQVSSDGRCFINNGMLLYCHLDGLSEYSLPSDVKTIPPVFTRNSIKKLSISEGTRIIESYAFQEFYSLKTLVLPTTIMFIGDSVLDGDTSLESLYLPARVPPSLRGYTSNVALSKLKVYVPEESYNDYLADPTWKEMWGKYLIPYHFDNVTPSEIYKSRDYSEDGKVVVLQSATEGNGIDLILMGSGFSDRQIADGSYLSVMENAADSFFEVEPYKSFRSLFNIYVVNIVSETEEGFLLNYAQSSSNYYRAQYERCIEYAQKAIPDERLDESTAVMICNAFGTGLAEGLTFFSIRPSTPVTDYGSGMGLAVFTTNEISALMKHEAGGHAFGKLDDEYYGVEVFPSSRIEMLKEDQKRGYWKNVDVTSNPNEVIWSKFLFDSRYDRELLGVYEGGSTYYGSGIFRPSERSIMRDNHGTYNAPSREAIYYRIHKLAYGPEWQYDYEEFVRWDQGLDNIHPTSVDTKSVRSGEKKYVVRDPLPVAKSNPDEWTVTVMK